MGEYGATSQSEWDEYVEYREHGYRNEYHQDKVGPALIYLMPVGRKRLSPISPTQESAPRGVESLPAIPFVPDTGINET